ncbi:hypothetical protein CEV33_1997 [Brucella grignonensis]|uniref:Uncharacterized protein n=1 Tax=Brucella grignonensis TaxID=94627 RepID=A0A256F6P8_9HYPH|nr:hypothetical protein CEV33_1997 [Brucella grignonensis]
MDIWARSFDYASPLRALIAHNIRSVIPQYGLAVMQDDLFGTKKKSRSEAPAYKSNLNRLAYLHF